MSITITLTHDKETLESLRDEWIDLQLRSSAKSMELSWQGINIYFKRFGKLGELWLMTAREDSRLLGIAPLIKVEQKSGHGFAWRQIEFISAIFDHEHLDFIIELDYEAQVIPLFIDKLFEYKTRWDVIRLTGLCDTKTSGILQQLDRDWIEFHEKTMIAPYMILPDTVDEWMRSISRNHRQKLRRYRRKLDEQFQDRWSITQVSQTDELDDTFENLVRLHQEWWESQGEPGVFHNDDWTEYYHELMNCMLKNGWLRLYRLDIDNTPCAVYYCYHYLGRAYFQIVGVNRNIADFPLGYVLQQHSIEQAIHEGCYEFTFMWGEQSYKYSFGGVSREHQAFQLIGNTRIRIQLKTVNSLLRIKSLIRIRSRISGIKLRIGEMVSEAPTDESR